MSDKVTYAFHYRSLDNNDISDDYAINDVANRELTYDSTITWCVVLRDFITFLSSVYGYDISKSVEYETVAQKLNRLCDKYEMSLDDEEESTDEQGEEAPKV